MELCQATLHISPSRWRGNLVRPSSHHFELVLIAMVFAVGCRRCQADATISTEPTSGDGHLAQSKDEDVVVHFLNKVEQYQRDKHKCVAGTEFKLGDGVVQQYGVTRFKAQAMVAVSRANLLTRLWMAVATAQQENMEEMPAWGRNSREMEDFLYAQVVNLVESDSDIFAAGSCHDHREFNDYYLFCPYAYRLPAENGDSSGESILVKDLSVEYNYLGNSSDWFFPARQKAERLIIERNTTLSYELLRYNGTIHGDARNRSVLLVKYEDGHWSEPYFDCGGGDIWMMTYTVPFFGYNNGVFRFKGTSGIDIDLQKVDINQCPLPQGSNVTNVFANSSRCLLQTTECQPLLGLGFRRGSYNCVCRRGFYFPHVGRDTTHQQYYNGVLVENEYEKLTKGEDNQYASFKCLQCSAGCGECSDSSPCILTLNWILRTCLLVASAATMCSTPALAFFIWKHREVKVIKASSPKLMWLTLLGATLMYCPMLSGFFEPSDAVCSARVWFRTVGFSTSYGALLLKTWRISVVFRVTSARTLRISDTDLIKRLGLVVLAAATYASVRTVWGRSRAVDGTHYSGLKTQQCSFDTWDYCQAGGELLLLLWGIRLCIVVRKAPSEFNESRFISWAIYNETLLSLFLSLAMLFLQSPANPDLLYIIQFIHTNLTTTVTLIFLFGSKAYLVYRRKQREATTKDDVLLKSKNSTGFRYTKNHKSSTNSDHGDNGVSILYKDIEDELSRVYCELEELKRQQMKADNPHVSATAKLSVPNNKVQATTGTGRNSVAGSAVKNNNESSKVSDSNGGGTPSTVAASSTTVQNNNLSSLNAASSLGDNTLSSEVFTLCACGSRSNGSRRTSQRSSVTAAAVRKIFLTIDDLKQATPV